MEKLQEKLDAKLTRSQYNEELFNEYRGTEDWPKKTSSSRFIKLLCKENFDELEKMILNDEMTDPLDLYNFWESVIDCYLASEDHLIGNPTLRKIKWLFDHNMAPDENQKYMLIPLLCDIYCEDQESEFSENNEESKCCHSHETGNYSLKEFKEIIKYLSNNNYSTFNMDYIVRYLYKCGYEDKEEILNTMTNLYDSTTKFMAAYVLPDVKK